MQISDKTMADIIIDLIHLSKNSQEMYRLAKQQQSESEIINSENQAMIKFVGQELPDKYKAEVLKKYKAFVQETYPNKLNQLDKDDQAAIDNLSKNSKKISGLLGGSNKARPILKALKKLTDKSHKTD